MEEDNIAFRLKYLISDLGINNSVFADNCGISRATLSQLLTGRNKKISDNLISQIHKAYPDLSILWLLFNEGSMWTSNKDANEPAHDGASLNDEDEATSSSRDQDHSTPDEHTRGVRDGRNSASVQINPSNFENFSSAGQTAPKYPKENGLNPRDFGLNPMDLQQVNSSINHMELINEIKNLKAKIKKVVQITVYYDDSTFESFFPK